MYTPGYATRTLLHRLYSISTTKMHTLAYAHCHTVIRTVTCAPTPVDSSCYLLCDSQASYCRRLCSIHVCGIFIWYYHRFLGSLDIASSMDCSYEAHRSVCIQFSVSKLVSRFRRSAVHHIAHLYRHTLVRSTLRSSSYPRSEVP